MTKNSINFTQLNKLSRPLAKSSLKIHSNNVEEFPKGTQARVYRTSAGVVTKFIRLDSKDESTVRFYRLISEHLSDPWMVSEPPGRLRSGAEYARARLQESAPSVIRANS